MNSESKITEKMFIHKLLPDSDMYCYIADNCFCISKKDFQLLSLPITEASFVFDEDLKSGAYFQKAVICKGRFYLRFEDSIYLLKNEEFVKRVTFSDEFQEPKTDLEGMFSLNDTLYVRQEGKLFKVDGTELIECLDFNGQGACYSFCGNVFHLENGEDDRIRLFKLNPDLKSELISELSGVEAVSVAHGGVMVIQGEKMYVLNMINGTLNEREFDSKYSVDNIHEVLELGSTGLQLKEENIIELMGPEFEKQAKEFYDKYIQDQIDRFPNYGQKVDKFLGLVREVFGDVE
ncbi:Conserved_hypothetical protein [Hexamita inflata]|uniref:Uncharacterized protein n=1 Tax=Hexamita inflata TaxID=28002 RepID=A0AA86PI16_9EUKA|nr:Conserved hypothetical protein [Hexamita inflata]